MAVENNALCILDALVQSVMNFKRNNKNGYVKILKNIEKFCFFRQDLFHLSVIYKSFVLANRPLPITCLALLGVVPYR